ncbi:PHYHIP-C domain-containing protein [Aphelenchoides besseyi]|nr:PHYHIP-C domain-containing protein [Aphelenchoides besseyi]
MTSNKLTVEAKSNGAKASWTFDGAPEGAEYQVTWMQEVFSKEQLDTLYAKAETFAKKEADIHRDMEYPSAGRSVDGYTSPITYIHRTKMRAYFDQLESPIMVKERRYSSGHPANALINEPELTGVWFSPCLFKNKLPTKSPFGDRRFLIDPNRVISSPSDYHLYFADFYCVGSAHYVTLVLCKNETDEDRFSQTHLKTIDMFNNIFFKVASTENGFAYETSISTYPELFITQDVALSDGSFDNVNCSTISGSTVGGVRHNPSCSHCNMVSIEESDSEANSAETEDNDLNAGLKNLSIKE